MAACAVGREGRCGRASEKRTEAGPMGSEESTMIASYVSAGAS